MIKNEMEDNLNFRYLEKKMDVDMRGG